MAAIDASGVWAIGLMSGTSLDGIDAALIKSDGERVIDLGPALTHPYSDQFRARLRALLGRDPLTMPAAQTVAEELTHLHVSAVRDLLGKAGMGADQVRVVGFHGHTVFHRPDLGVTRQLGDPDLLARETGIPVVGELRQSDVAMGGEGAPFAPAYHRALAADLEKPLAVLNLGGVGNVTFIAEDGSLLAFDTGPGNALIDDWVQLKSGQACDEGGALAAAGRTDKRILAALLDHNYFLKEPPKSLDRDDFAIDPAWTMTAQDGAATLTCFTAAAVGRALDWLPVRPKRWLVTGGGRHNRTLMARLAQTLEVPVEPVEVVGWHGDALEAQAFGYLALRSIKGLPLSYPETTGVPAPQPGGRLFEAA